MLVLHGIYDNGKVEIEEKDLPEGKASFEIKLENEEIIKKNLKGNILEDIPARGLWKNRKDIPDSVEFVRNLRKNTGRRYL